MCMVQIKLADLDKAAALYKEALQANPDDWTSLQLYLDCILPCTAQPESAVRKCNALDRLQTDHGLTDQQVQPCCCNCHHYCCCMLAA